MITVRLFRKDEWHVFRDVRLRALLSDPRSFGSSYKKAMELTDADWQERLNKENVGNFVVLDGDAVIGMTGTMQMEDNPENVKLWGSWLDPQYRGRGISKMMYEARFEWARARPGAKRVIVSHREHNVASKAANQKHGFVYTHRERQKWHDGTEEDDVFYALDL